MRSEDAPTSAEGGSADAEVTATSPSAGAGTLSPPPTTNASSDELVARAREATENGHYAEARRLLAAALAASPSPAIAFNLALVHRSLGELLAARSVFERLLAGDFGALPEERRVRAEELLSAIRANVGAIFLSVRGANQADVRVDGVLIGATRGTSPLRIAVDPGAHALLVTPPSGPPRERAIEVGRGGSISVTIDLGAVPLATAPDGPGRTGRTPDEADEADEPSVFASPWLWVAAAAAVGGVVAVSLVAFDSPEPELPGGFVGSAETLRF